MYSACVIFQLERLVCQHNNFQLFSTSFIIIIIITDDKGLRPELTSPEQIMY